ncbi:hypothetical protein A2708_02300 [Candidatus Saccharibacteria bacterium RIFCSPHIGHO2_01_FULL_49_21]|nr:MAG: hypothetical protein A2708_02300 [Candidatus Saccharibacteria bacterium RIFCSPHIGHO2_01_FULL_49_21]OGL37354.1 MAG: hypothetical protein A3B63_02270 [Candidatus Saccharibacteria bacterium RIFCSPLOWO2_01_FULL_49_22]
MEKRKKTKLKYELDPEELRIWRAVVFIPAATIVFIIVVILSMLVGILSAPNLIPFGGGGWEGGILPQPIQVLILFALAFFIIISLLFFPISLLFLAYVPVRCGLGSITNKDYKTIYAVSASTILFIVIIYLLSKIGIFGIF